MKYRIKITTFANGRKEYAAQKKCGWIWKNLHLDGETCVGEITTNGREDALNRIDKNYSGNVKKQTIEFEYFNK